MSDFRPPIASHQGHADCQAATGARNDELLGIPTDLGSVRRCPGKTGIAVFDWRGARILRVSRHSTDTTIAWPPATRGRWS